MQDTYDAISQALPAVAPMLSPAKAAAVMDVLIETSPLPADIKKKFRDAGEKEAAAARSEACRKRKAKLQLEQQSDRPNWRWSSRVHRADGAGRRKGQGRHGAEAAGCADRAADRAARKRGSEMQIEREKAQNQMQIEQFKAEQTAQLSHARRRR